VLDIKVLEDGKSVCRELIMVKVRANAAQRTEIISLADIFRAKIVDVETDSLMLEMTGTQSKVEAFLDLVSPYEVLELARTGITGLSRGSKDVVMFED
jgi:acetolactate synthase-1/3 small subunit